MNRKNFGSTDLKHFLHGRTILHIPGVSYRNYNLQFLPCKLHRKFDIARTCQRTVFELVSVGSYRTKFQIILEYAVYDAIKVSTDLEVV